MERTTRGQLQGKRWRGDYSRRLTHVEGRSRTPRVRASERERVCVCAHALGTDSAHITPCAVVDTVGRAGHRAMGCGTLQTESEETRFSG